MNKKKMRKIRNQTQVLLMLVVLIFAGATPSYGVTIKGSTIKIIMKDGSEIKGELLAISDQTLVLFDNTIAKESRVNIAEVELLMIYQKSVAGKGFINGGALGAIAATFFLGENKQIGAEYRGLYIALFSALGGGIGTICGLLSLGADDYYPANMSASDIEALLARLRTSTRKDIPWEKAYRNGWLGPLRISWRPYFNHEIHMDIKGNVQFPENPGTPTSGKQSTQPFILLSKSNIYDDGTHTGRIRVDYVLRKNFSLGFEFVSLGKHYINGGTLFTMVQDQKEYIAPFYFYGNNTASAGLVGVSYDVSISGENLSNFRIETGVGLSFIRVNLVSNQPTSNWPVAFHNTYNMVSPAFQVSVSLDFYPDAIASTGIYLSFMYAPASFPGIKESCTLGFTEANMPYRSSPVFTREGIVNIPESNFRMGGASLGFFIRFR